MTPQPLHGRLMGAVESLAALCLAVGLPLGGALVGITSTRTAFAVAGAGTLATTIAFARLTRLGLGRQAAGAPATPEAQLSRARPEALVPGHPAPEERAPAHAGRSLARRRRERATGIRRPAGR